MGDHLRRAVDNILRAQACLPDGTISPQAYYVPLDEWHAIRDELMDMTRDLPRVNGFRGFPFFQLLAVPVVSFSVLDAVDANA